MKRPLNLLSGVEHEEDSEDPVRTQFPLFEAHITTLKFSGWDGPEQGNLTGRHRPNPERMLFQCPDATNAKVQGRVG